MGYICEERQQLTKSFTIVAAEQEDQSCQESKLSSVLSVYKPFFCNENLALPHPICVLGDRGLHKHITSFYCWSFNPNTCFR